MVAGIIINQNKILIGKRKDKDIGGGKWEFPGGKIEVGEINSEALERELYEELGIRSLWCILYASRNSNC